MSESIIEKALLEAEQLEETMKSNAKEILSSTMKEEINELVKESLSEEDDYLKEREEIEQEVELEVNPMLGDMDTELDFEDETEDIDMLSDELPPLDLTSASDEEVIKVFKAMGSEDGIIVQQDGDEIALTDGDEEYLLKLEQNRKTMKKRNLKEMDEPMYEIEMDAEDEPMYEIELDEGGEHTHDAAGIPQSIPASGVMGVDAPESEEALDDYDEDTMGMEMSEDSPYIPKGYKRYQHDAVAEEEMNEDSWMINKRGKEDWHDGAVAEMDEPMYEIELEEEPGMPGHHDHDDRYDLKQGYNDRLDDTLGAKDGAEHGMTQSFADRRRESGGMEKAMGRPEFSSNRQSNQGEMGEGSRILPFGKPNSSNRMRRPMTNNRNLKETARTKGRQLQENYHNLKKEVTNLKGKNGEYRKALVTFKQKLNEVGVFNSNLAYATRLFTEHSTTKQEKVNILRRFDIVNSLKESKGLYRVIREELSQNKTSNTKSKKSISEAVDRRINSTPKSGSHTRLMETKAYENPQFSRIKDLMSKL